MIWLAKLVVTDELHKIDSLQHAQVRDVAFDRVIKEYEVSTPTLKAQLNSCELILNCTHPYFHFFMLSWRKAGVQVRSTLQQRRAKF